MPTSYRWSISDGYPEKNGLTVFSTFACGGGSTMGYKLSGFDVLGANDIDPQMQKVYVANHHPSLYYLMPISDMVTADLDPRLFDLDVLDGSPPCSTFSTAGLREKAWGKEKHFREGQAKQVLDDLFFDFLALADRLRPKCIVAENVSGMLKGNARGYTQLIRETMRTMGYGVRVYLLNGATMGLPQRRQRVFFIGVREDVGEPPELSFDYPPVTFGEIEHAPGKPLNTDTASYRQWLRRLPTDRNFGTISERTAGRVSNFNQALLQSGQVPPTVTAANRIIKYDEPEELSVLEYAQISSFPLDYDYCGVEPKYLMGMSVPPLMMARVSEQVALQSFHCKTIS